MNSTQHFDLPTPARRTVLAGVSGSSDDTIGFRLRAAGSSFFWAMRCCPISVARRCTRYMRSAAKSMTSRTATRRAR
jgi:hypothetical protein